MKTISLLTLLFATSAAIAQEAKLTGVWDLKNISSEFKRSQTVISQSGNEIKVFGRKPEAKWTLIGTGEISNMTVTVKFANQTSPAEFIIKDGTLLAKEGKGSAVVAARLSSLYVCKNHVPTNHVAGSMSEMKELTRVYKCSGWHSSDSSTAEDLPHLLDLMPASAKKE